MIWTHSKQKATGNRFGQSQLAHKQTKAIKERYSSGGSRLAALAFKNAVGQSQFRCRRSQTATLTFVGQLFEFLL